MQLFGFLFSAAIESTRKDYYCASREQREVLEATCGLWRRLKDLRRSQGFTSTTCKLVVVKIDAPLERERREWDAEIRRRIDEERHLFERDLEQERNQYRALRDQWRKQRRQVL